MKTDTQHLEFLISQYVDGTLDPAARKTIEQQLLTDPVARRLYQEHQETQDVLDDFGSRLPMINWSEFEATLGERLEKETSATRSKFFGGHWKKWTKPAAVAAGLLLAVGIGYFMRAIEVPTSRETLVQVPASSHVPERSVMLEFPKDNRAPGMARVDYTGNVPPATKSFSKVEVGEDLLRAIDEVRKDGSMERWSIGREPARNWLPQAQPGAVEARDNKTTPRPELENGLQ
jgi:hypothetical protein